MESPLELVAQQCCELQLQASTPRSLGNARYKIAVAHSSSQRHTSNRGFAHPLAASLTDLAVHQLARLVAWQRAPAGT